MDNKKTSSKFSEDNFQKSLKENNIKHQERLSDLKKIGLLFGGAGLAVAGMSFMPSKPEEFNDEEPIVLLDNPPMATGINDSMSYNEAWEQAREEVGAGGYFVWNNHTFSTYSQEEWAQIEPEDRQEFLDNVDAQYENYVVEEPTEIPLVIYDEAPVSHIVTEDMSFGDAFALARQDVGPGGVFVWHGKTYGTYYKEEWDQMTPEDKSVYFSSVEHMDLDLSTDHHSDIQAVVVDNDDREVFIGDEFINVDNDEEVRFGFFLNNGEVVAKMDVDNDGSYDYILDIDSEQLIGLNGFATLSFQDINNIMEGNGEPIVIAENYELIDGQEFFVTTFSDGSQHVKIDADNDGTFDEVALIDSDGHYQIYDINDIDSVDNSFGHENFANLDNDLLDNHLNNDFGTDFNDHGDVSDWI